MTSIKERHLSSPPPLYGSLDTTERQIRLLTLESKDEQDGTLNCTLETVSLDDQPEYAALSYVWGDAKITETIHVNDHAMPVTVNLAAALRQIRAKDSDWANRRLWIDAVCINQRDLLERNAQVAMMCSIYRYARNVVMWLGETGVGSRTAENVARAMSIVSSWRNLAVESLEQNIGHVEKNEPERHDGDALSLAALLEVNYWTRTWVIQEAALAASPVLLCGSYEAEICGSTATTEAQLAFRRFVLGIQLMFTHRSESMPPAGMAVSFAHMVLHSSVESIGAMVEADLYLLRFTRMTRCADPRDYVYSLVGVLQKHFDVQVDYGQSFKEVYAQATMAFMRHSRSLDLLMGGQFDKKGWPSWVTDFANAGERQYELTCNNFMFERSLNASKGATFALELVDPDTISVSAFLADTIDHVCRGLDDLETPNSRCRIKLGQWLALYQALFCRSTSQAHGRAFPPASTEPHAFWKSICLGDRSYSHSKTLGDFGLGLTSWDQYYEHLDKTFDSAEAATLDGDIWNIPRGIARTCTFFVTYRGYVGVAAGPIAVGDRLAILAGCRFPFCLRPALHATRSAYELAAPAYVQGIMQGEALSEAMPRGYTGTQKEVDTRFENIVLV